MGKYTSVILYPSRFKNPVIALLRRWVYPRRDNKYRSLWRKIESEAFPLRKFSFASGIVFSFILLPISPAIAEKTEVDYTAMGLEALMDVQITSVSKKEQKVSESAAAIYVITSENIRRSGATSIPEALRLAPGLHVAQVDSHRFAISSRGFNGVFANKMLVLIDGRSVYTPLFSGVYWDVQDTMLEDIERIEVIRGPGAAVWGANAVNGVINIITKNSADTQGVLFSGGGGTEETVFTNLRYGTEVGEAGHFRVYGKFFERDSTELQTGEDAFDEWNTFRGGFRGDFDLSEDDSLTVQGDIYSGEEELEASFPKLTAPFTELRRETLDFSGGNLLTRWTRDYSEDSQFALQMYWDHVNRDDLTLKQTRDTLDLELTHQHTITPEHELIWGLGYRFITDEVLSRSLTMFIPEERDDSLFSGFVQHQYQVSETLTLIAGTKIEHNEFTQWEVQPTARALWSPSDTHTFWASFSRAVRTPSRANDDLLGPQVAFPSDAGTVVVEIQGNRDFEADTLLAYELGYRFQLDSKLSADIAAFYNNYDDLRTLESGPSSFRSSPTPAIISPLIFDNRASADAAGVELLIDYVPCSWWHLQGAYSFLQLNYKRDKGSTDRTVPVADGTRQDPRNQFSIRSFLTLPQDMEFDALFRYVDNIPGFSVESYFELDLRLAWHPTENIEIALVGQDLLESSHFEYASNFVASAPSEIERSVYGKITIALD